MSRVALLFALALLGGALGFGGGLLAFNFGDGPMPGRGRGDFLTRHLRRQNYLAAGTVSGLVVGVLVPMLIPRRKPDPAPEG